MDINENNTVSASSHPTYTQGLNGNQSYSKVDSMDAVIGHDIIQSEKTSAATENNQSSPKTVSNLNFHSEDRPILNGVVNPISPDENKEMRITDVKLETLKQNNMAGAVSKERAENQPTEQRRKHQEFQQW